MGFVPHLPHDLAGAVLEERRAHVLTDGPEDPAQLVFTVTIDRQAAQAGDAAAMLQFVADAVEQGGDGAGEWAVPAELLQVRGIEGVDPAWVALQVVRGPDGRTGDGFTRHDGLSPPGHSAGPAL